MSNFWADKLNGQQHTPAAPAPRVLYPNVQPVPMPQVNLPGYPPVAMPAVNTGPAQQMPDYTPSVRLIQGSTCPGCGSDRYRGSIGDRAIACGECGYHPRFEQSGYGERSHHTNPGDAAPARQVQGTQTMQSSIALLNAGGGVHLK